MEILEGIMHVLKIRKVSFANMSYVHLYCGMR